MRVILITGASSGIGAATARALAAPNAAIALHARKNRAGLEQVAAFVADDDIECLQLIRRLLGYLPRNNLEDPPAPAINQRVRRRRPSPPPGQRGPG